MKIRSYGIPPMLLLGVLSTVVLASASLASASGSYSPQSASSLGNPYHLGKVTYYRKLACSSCPLSQTKLNVFKAKDLVDRLKSDKQLMMALNDSERSAVAYYLKQRYGR